MRLHYDAEVKRLYLERQIKNFSKYSRQKLHVDLEPTPECKSLKLFHTTEILFFLKKPPTIGRPAQTLESLGGFLLESVFSVIRKEENFE